MKHAGPRGPLFRALPSAPVLVGVAALAVSTGGAVTAADSGLVPTVEQAVEGPSFLAANALGGTTAVSRVSSLADRRAAVSRDSRRDALADAAEEDLQEEAEAQNQQRNAALARFAKKAEQQAAKIAANAWVLPVSGYDITNTFGLARSYYASGYHTGLDFAAPMGSEVSAIAGGVVTQVGYDGAYGNKIVVTLDDGTELWYGHLSGFAASVGEEVRSGEVIGYVGSTGNSTGPHLHVEVRPGAGDPVDPFQAFVVHGITP